MKSKIQMKATKIFKQMFAKEQYAFSQSNFKNYKMPELNIIVEPCRAEIKTPRINLLIPEIDKEKAYGGINTALSFFKELSKNYSDIRFITCENPTNETLEEYPDYQYIAVGQNITASKQIVSLSEHQDRPLPVGAEDIFVCTIWYTAYLAQRFAIWQGQEYNQPIKPIIYFIQDYEPGFYPWSSQYILARSTYEYKKSMIAVYNTKLLQEYFHRQGYKFDYEYSFEPRMNQELQKLLPRLAQTKKKKQILIYGRPYIPRNAFSLILEALYIWQDLFPESSSWNVVSAGQPHPDIVVSPDLTIKSLGKLRLEDYANLLSESSIGLSFMVSPHPSYPPLEMSHYGMWVLTNSYDNKDLSQWHENIVSLNNLFPENVAEYLLKLCQKVGANPTLGWQSRSHTLTYVSNEPVFDFIDQIAKVLDDT